MLRIFFIIIASLTFKTAFAEEKTLQTIEEITKELERKEAELQPFNPDDIKIDIESLGLDDVEETVVKEKVKEPKKKVIKIKNRVEKTDPIQIPKIEPEKKPVKEKKKKAEEVKSEKKLQIKEEKEPEKKPEKKGFITKIQSFLTDDEDKKEEKTEEKSKDADLSKPKKTLPKKLLLQNIMILENKRILNEKKRQAKLLKLQILRKKYLQDFSRQEKRDAIVPRRKELSKFVTGKLPARPILTRYRTSDNIHIPIVFTPQERVQMLFDAIASGNVAYFNSTYEYVKNPNAKNRRGDTMLAFSVTMQKHPITTAILNKGANPNATNSLGYSPMDIAIEMLDLKSIELLIKNKARTDYIDAFGRTYLMHAARVGFLPAVQLFIASGIDVNAMDQDGFTALSIAYRHKKEVIVKYLLKNGAKTWIEKPYDPKRQSLIQELENRW